MVDHRDIVGTQCRHMPVVGSTIFNGRSCYFGNVIRMGVSSAMGFEEGIMADAIFRIIRFLIMVWMWISTASSLFFFSVALHIVPRTGYIDASVPTSHFVLAGFAEGIIALCIYVNRENF